MKKTGLFVLAVGLLLGLCVPAAWGQAKPKSIKLMVDGTFQAKENGEDLIVKEFKNITGVELLLNHPAHNEYYTKVDLAFTTGDIPDVVLLGGTNYTKFAQSGLLLDLSELYAKSSFKNQVKDQGIIEALRIKGKLYGIPFERGGGTITYVRGDWLEKLGMAPPTNYNEFLEMLRAFKNKNPDGLKPADVIPITSAGLMNTEFPNDIYLREFYQDAVPDFIDVGGKWVDGMLQPNMIPALERMRQAYSEGLIDKEIITNKTSTARDKFYTGRVGVFNYWSGGWNETLQMSLTPNVPKGKVTPIPAIKETKYIERVPAAFCIPKSVKDPAAVFKYFHEVVLDGGKGQTLASWGVEGKFYKVVDGKIVFLPSLADPKKPFSKAFISGNNPINKWDSRFTPSAIVQNSMAMFEAHAKPVSLVPYTEEAMELVADINTIRAKYIAKAVYGEMTIQAALATYAKETSKYNRIILRELNR